MPDTDLDMIQKAMEDFKKVQSQMFLARKENAVIQLSKTWKHKTLEERAAEYGGELNFDGEYNWGEPVGRKVW